MALTGKKLEGLTHYYAVAVKQPMNGDVAPYIAECGDIIEALNLTFNEGNVLKALWRSARARQGAGKEGTPVAYDLDKLVHYAERTREQNLRALTSGESE